MGFIILAALIISHFLPDLKKKRKKINVQICRKMRKYFITVKFTLLLLLIRENWDNSCTSDFSCLHRKFKLTTLQPLLPSHFIFNKQLGIKSYPWPTTSIYTLSHTLCRHFTWFVFAMFPVLKSTSQRLLET